MNRLKFLLVALAAGCLSGAPVFAQQARQMARSTTGFGDSSLVITSDTLSSKTTFVTKAVSVAQFRKSLSKFAFDSVLSTKFNMTGATITGAPTWSSTQTLNTSGTSATVTGATQASITTAANLTTIGTLVAGAVPASLVTAGTFASGAFVFPSTLRMTNIGMGIAPDASRGIDVGTVLTTSGSQYGIDVIPTFNSSATTAAYGIHVGPQTSNSSFTIPNAYGLYLDDWTKGASNTITNQYGLFVKTPTKGGTNIGIWVDGGGLTVNAGTTAVQALTAAADVTLSAGDLKLASGLKAIFNSGTNNIYIQNNSAGRMTFVATAEVMRIDAGVGLNVTGSITSSAGISATAGTFSAMPSEGSTQSAVCITAGGVLQQNAAASCLVSARRFKHGIVDLPLADAFNITTKLRPVAYEENGSNQKRIGLIAEEADQVDHRLGAFDNKGQITSVNYEEVTIALLKTVQDMQRRMDRMCKSGIKEACT